MAPAMWFDRVIVTPTEIRQKTGLWFAPRHRGFRYCRGQLGFDSGSEVEKHHEPDLVS